jgi:hypothetical protein
LLTSPVNLPLEQYAKTRGLRSGEAIRLLQRFGANSVDIPAPTFLNVYINQILGPVPVFQVSQR